MSDNHDDEIPAPHLREATDAEQDLIVGLARGAGHRLLRDWDELPADRKVLPMNRAFLSAMALNIGNFLGAAAVNDPGNLEGWQVLVEQTLEIARQTALEKRELALKQGTVGGAPTLLEEKTARRVLIPQPNGVM